MRIPHLLAAAALAASIVFPTAGAADTGRAPQASSPIGQAVTVEPVRPYRPGDKVWLTSPPVTELRVTSMSAADCQRVPATGYIGTNVYADSYPCTRTTGRGATRRPGSPFTGT